MGLNAETLEFVWSASLQGVVAGTPRVGSDAEHVYVTHNKGDQGMFSTLSISSGGDTLYFYSPATQPGVGGFAPVGISFTPIPDGNYANGFRNTNDFVSWANLPSGGEVVAGAIPKGATHGFQLPRTGAEAQVQLLTETSWSTRTPPTLSTDGQSMFYSVSAGSRRACEVRAWPGPLGKNFGAGSAFNGKGSFQSDGAQPSDSGIALSIDETKFFYASTANALYCINSNYGDIMWKDESLPGVVKATPVVSPDGLYVYFITVDGTVCAKDVETGATVWTMKNGSNPSVTADFAIDEDGVTLHYGVAESSKSTTYYELQLADIVSSTAEPTSALPPSIATTDQPTLEMTEEPSTAEPTLPKSSQPTMSPVKASDSTPSTADNAQSSTSSGSILFGCGAIIICALASVVGLLAG